MPLVLANIFQPLIDVFEQVLLFFHDTIGFGWGFSIVFLTIIVRALLLPLTIKQFKSMRALQILAPLAVRSHHHGRRRPMRFRGPGGVRCCRHPRRRGPGAFLDGGPAIIVATADDQLQPEISRGWGPQLAGDGESLELCVGAAPGSRTQVDLARGGVIAATFSVPTTYRTVQLKGAPAGFEEFFVEIGVAGDEPPADPVMPSPDEFARRLAPYGCAITGPPPELA